MWTPKPVAPVYHLYLLKTIGVKCGFDHFSRCVVQVTFYDPDIPVSLQSDQDLCHPYGERREIRVDRVTVTCSTAISWECNSVNGGQMPQRQGSDASYRSPSAFSHSPVQLRMRVSEFLTEDGGMSCISRGIQH